MSELPPAKKSLGQCFLIDRGYARQIADSLLLKSGETVLEVGPGRGILTGELLAKGACVIAVEIDRRLAEPLSRRFGSSGQFALRTEDILVTEISAIAKGETLKVAGNLPYHLVAEVLFKLFAHARRARADNALPWVEAAVLMMQKEVADRVVAHPGTKSWGKLSVFAQLEAYAGLLFTVPSGAFRPTPRVDGGVVRLDFQRLPVSYPSDYAMLERIVRHCFHQRRKMLKTSLASLDGVHPFWQEADLDFRRRPETLSPAEWVMLADTITRARERREDRRRRG